MQEGIKLPLKRVELSLSKFNEVAIPHHLDLLRQHKANIIKYEEAGELRRVCAEQTHARRVAGQLRTLLAELDALRQQVRPEDWPKFDALTKRSRDLTLRAIVDYLETAPLAVMGAPAHGVGAGAGADAASSALSTDSVGVVAHHTADRQLQLHVDEQELALAEREAVLEGWSSLQAEVRALHGAWRLVHEAALAQRPQVAQASDSVERSADDVAAARGHLASAERLRLGAMGVGGAALGALLGGPLGLVLGAKVGAAAAVAGGALGYLGARVVAKRRDSQIADHSAAVPLVHAENDKDR